MQTTFDPDASLWLSALRAAGRSPVTVAGYQHAWQHFLDWLDRPATECTRRDALAYVEQLRPTNEPSSVAHHVRGLRAGYALDDPRGTAHRRQPFRQPPPVGA
jgi:hypothetical protein